MALSESKDLHFAQAALTISAKNSLLRLEVPVMIGTATIWSHLSMEVAARGKLQTPLEQGFFTMLFPFLKKLCGTYYMPGTFLCAFIF